MPAPMMMPTPLAVTSTAPSTRGNCAWGSATGVTRQPCARAVVRGPAARPTGRAEGPFRLVAPPEPGQSDHDEAHRGGATLSYLALVVAVFAVNLLPALGPPTWAILVLFRLHQHLNPIALVALGALAAASGRLVLATAAKHFSGRLSPRYRQRLDRARDALTRHRSGAIAGLGLFALSPVPSGQLFVAVGLLRLPRVPLTAAFFAGRIVSYSLYVTAASLAQATLGDVVLESFRSPLAIAVQLAFLAAISLVPLVDWRRPATQ